MDTGGNLTAKAFVPSKGQQTLVLVALGPPNPPWEGIYENQQTSLYFSQNWGAGWSSFPAGAMNQYPIDPENAVALCWPPAVISWDLYHLDVFVAGQDGSLWHLPGAGAPLSDGNNVRGLPEFSYTWSDWVFLGYPSNKSHIANIVSYSAPALFTRGENMIDVVVLGDDGRLWYLAYDNGWQPWVRLPRPPVGIASVPNMTGHSSELRVYVTGDDGNVWQIKYVSGSWSGWANLSAPAIGLFAYDPPTTAVTYDPPCAVFLGDNYGFLFVRGKDGSGWYNVDFAPSQGAASAWTGWTKLFGAGKLAGPPSMIFTIASTSAPGQGWIHVLGIGPEGQPVHIKGGRIMGSYETPDWGTLETIPSPAPLRVDQVCEISGGGSLLDFFAVDAADSATIYHFWNDVNDDTILADWNNEVLPPLNVEPVVMPGS
jgi:hypothetical protein